MLYRILMIFFMSLPLAVSAQLDWGMKAGLNQNTIHVSDDPYYLEDYGWQAGLHGGVFGTIELSDKLGAGAELLFSQRGFSHDGARHVLNYLTLPVFLRYELFSEFTIEAGMSASLLLGYRIEQTRIRDLAEDASASVLAGLSYQLDDQWHVSARYYLALSPYLESEYSDDGGTSTDRIRNYTRTIELSIGFRVL